jgi:hypothetical protein
MSSLSKEIAKWIQTNPGPITGDSEDSVWLQAKLIFTRDRRWRGEIDMATFMTYIHNCGYKVEGRTNHGDKSNYAHLALPERHKGF